MWHRDSHNLATVVSDRVSHRDRDLCTGASIIVGIGWHECVSDLCDGDCLSLLTVFDMILNATICGNDQLVANLTKSA